MGFLRAFWKGFSSRIKVKGDAPKASKVSFLADGLATSEVIKATLMAGADRYADNIRGADLTTYTVDTTNNLDDDFGAGQMNVYNSYRILAAGEQDSSQDGGSSPIGMLGWDYDPDFGGVSGSNSTATYSFTATSGADHLTATLAWNIDINSAISTATLHDLDLELYEVTGTPAKVSDSASTVHNTENLFFDLTPGNQYEMRVVQGTGSGNFVWDYGLAWQVVPEPSSLVLVIFGVLALLPFLWRRRSSWIIFNRRRHHHWTVHRPAPIPSTSPHHHTPFP